MQPVQPIQTVELFPPLSAELIALLRSLSRDDWDKTTACAAWNVKQVALHLLGGNVGRLYRRRDELNIPENLRAQYAFLWQVKDALERPNKPIADFGELVQWIDRTNAEWVQAAASLDTNALIDLLELSDAQLDEYFKQLDPNAPARISVLWAGETQSLNWFDIAREYTEKWLHQQHIREAVNAPLLDTREFLYPVLDTFLRALRHTYRAVQAPNGTAISIHITGQAGGDWSLVRQNDAWVLCYGSAPNALTRVTIDQNLAWRVFTKGVSAEQARVQIQIDGDETVGAEILRMVSIMA